MSMYMYIKICVCNFYQWTLPTQNDLQQKKFEYYMKRHVFKCQLGKWKEFEFVIYLYTIFTAWKLLSVSHGSYLSSLLWTRFQFLSDRPTSQVRLGLKLAGPSDEHLIIMNTNKTHSASALTTLFIYNLAA